MYVKKAQETVMHVLFGRMQIADGKILRKDTTFTRTQDIGKQVAELEGFSNSRTVS